MARSEPATRTAEIWVDRVRADHVGRRVVVRYRLRADDKATDVLGRLVDRHAGALRIRRADDSFVDVPLADVVSTKPVPERRVTRRDVRALEAAAAKGWRAPDTAQSGRLAAARRERIHPAGQLCLPLATPGCRFRPPSRRSSAGTPPGCRPHVPSDHPSRRGRGLPVRRTRPGTVRGRPGHDLAAGTGGRRAAASISALVAVTAEPDDAWLAAYHYRGEILPAHARHVLVHADTVGFAAVDEMRVALSRVAVTDAPDGRRWVGITAVEVEPAARRRGLGTCRGGVA